MKRTYLAMTLLAVVAVLPATAVPRNSRQSPREALRAFNHFIGSWKGTGIPEGTREEKERGLWEETMSWGWRFKGEDAWLTVTITKGKHFVRGQLRYLPDENLYRLTLETTGKESVAFTGRLTDRRLTLDRTDPKTKEGQRLVFSLLHSNRFLYAYEVKPSDRTAFTRVYRVGATKKGVPFASADAQPECVVSGGLGTIKVSYQGKTYHVCCSGCRAEFNENPAKYVKEYEAKKAKQSKEK
jgi:hypothetical protein